MKSTALTLLVSLTLACPALIRGKEKKADPRIKQIHTVFVKEEHNVASDALRANLEKWTCFKAAPNHANADAVISVLWMKDSRNTPDVASSVQAAAQRPLSIGQNLVYQSLLTPAKGPSSRKSGVRALSRVKATSRYRAASPS